jgi:pyrimidine operon attenuation protein/uracil phosphoribosyltransferase
VTDVTDPTRQTLLDEAGVRRALARMAHEIVERNHGTTDLVLVGVVTRGALLAERLRQYIRQAEGVEVPLGRLDITLYRDDVGRSGRHPVPKPSEIPFDLDDRTVVLVDDVLFTGRTVRAGLDALMDFGRPRAVQLAVLVDRGHRELPIQPDYVGQAVRTVRDQRVELRLKELAGEDSLALLTADTWRNGMPDRCEPKEG